MNEFTLGVEEEFMVIDPVSRELKSHEQKIVESAQKIHEDQVKAEMHQAVVEVGTNICRNTEEARKEVTKLRGTVAQLAGDIGLRIGAAGTHPFSHWQTQLITDHPRYFEIVDEMQEAARSNLIFGLHVHVGIQSRDLAVFILPTRCGIFYRMFMLCLPIHRFGKGVIPGSNPSVPRFLINFRVPVSRLFQQYRRVRPVYQIAGKTNCIDNAKKIWWDIRVHPFLETIEFRICDCPMLIDETMAFVAHVPGFVRQIVQNAPAKYGFYDLQPCAHQRKQMARRTVRYRRQND